MRTGTTGLCRKASRVRCPGITIRNWRRLSRLEQLLLSGVGTSLGLSEAELMSLSHAELFALLWNSRNSN